MGQDASGAGARWQGYSHQQLYDMIHSGPGSGAAGAVADTWSGMSGALQDIQQDINKGVTTSGATWVGAAADSARGALGPLGEWAQQAATAADVMRVSVELQGDLLGKARADMPVPVAVPQQSQISQLVTSQVDFEVAEMASEVATQQAFQVMAQYEAGTTDNMSSLGDFSSPPQLVVDTAPITGLAVRGSSGIVEPTRSTPSFRSRTTGGSTAGTAGRPSSPSSTSPSSGRTAERTPSSASDSTDHVITTSPDEATPAPPSGLSAGTTTSSFAGPDRFAGPDHFASPDHVAGSVAGTPVIGEPATTPSSAEVMPSAAVDDRNRKTTAGGGSPTLPPPSDRFSGAAVVPAARRPDGEGEPEVHESRYLLEADDIYGAGQTYSPPVIGETRQRR